MARLFPACDPPFLEGIPRGDGVIGPGWPKRHAEARGLALTPEPDGGLLPDLERVRGPRVDPDAIAPGVRAFYEHTARYRLAVEARWSAPFRLATACWVALWSRRWGQLELPLRDTAALSNEIWELSMRTARASSSSSGGEGTLWVRTFLDERGAPTGRALYISRYDVVEVAGEPDPCVRISFPVPGGTWVVLFRLEVRGGDVVLTERGGRPGGPGLYLVPAGGPARYVRMLREEITVWQTPEGARAEHRFELFGFGFLRLLYALPTQP